MSQKSKIVIFVIITLLTLPLLPFTALTSAQSFNLVRVDEYDIDVGYTIQIESNYAYITGNDGLIIFNVSDPNNVNMVQNVTLPYGSLGAHVVEGIAYIADLYAGFYIVNLTDIYSPEIIGHDNSTTIATNAFVLDDLAFITDYDNGVFIYDVSNKSDPVLESQYYTGGNYWQTAAKGEIVYIANPQIGIDVVNITEPSTPMRISVISSTLGVTCLTIHDNYLYAGKHGNGLNVFDISTPASPVLLGSYYDNDGGEELGVRGNGTLMAVADNYGVELFDITGLPTISKITEQRDNVVAAHDCELLGNYIFVVDGASGFFVLEIVEQHETPTVVSYPVQTSLLLFVILSLSVVKLSKRNFKKRT